MILLAKRFLAIAQNDIKFDYDTVSLLEEVREIMTQINVFDRYCKEYDEWFIENNDIFISELKILKSLIPKTGNGIEIGVGTGRFASELGISIGIDPSVKMAETAKTRNIKVVQAKAENMPIEDESYDFATMITTICFVNNVKKTLSEVNRILKRNGVFLVAFIDRESDLGKIYQKKKADNKFYRNATFYSTKEIINYLKYSDFNIDKIKQSLFIKDGIIETKEIKDNYGTGGFVVIKAVKSKRGKHCL